MANKATGERKHHGIRAYDEEWALFEQAGALDFQDASTFLREVGVKEARRRLKAAGKLPAKKPAR